MNIHKLYHLFFRYFRPKRMRQFSRVFGLTPETRVLDVGGTLFNWSFLPEMPQLVILNISLPPMERDRSITWVVGDGRHLPFKDGAFDIVYSNSVIEHLGSLENQRLFANECRRVGIRYYVQTPNKWFPVEPHLITPFIHYLIHYLPRPVQRLLLRYFTVWGIVTRPTVQQCDNFLREVRLLDERALKELFPNAEIWRERVFGITKSLMLVKPQTGDKTCL